MYGVGPRLDLIFARSWIWAKYEKNPFEVELMYLIEMTLFKIFNFLIYS